MKVMRALLLAAGWIFATCTAALAQGSPGLVYNQVMTPAQWNAAFAAKQDFLGAAPCIITGCQMTGKLVTKPSTAPLAGFNVPAGVAPSSPVDGDMWSTTAGLFIRINGVTVGPLTGGTAGGFAGTSPITVSFPAGVVTYAFNFGVANTFTAVQSVSLNSGALPAAITGTAIRAAQANATTTRIVAEGYGAIAAMTVARAQGTAASPTQVTSGLEVGGFNAFAWGSNAAWNGPIASIRAYAAENITGTAWGSKVCLATTPTTTATMADVLCQQASGGLTTGAATDQGAGTLNLAGNLYNNGSAPTGTAGYVRATSPTITSASLVTPALGVATGTSLALGGATIGGNALAVTGTSLFNNGVTFSAAITYGGVTLSNAVTGTGNVVLSASPTLSGTVAGSITLSGNNTYSGSSTFSGAHLLTATITPTALSGSVNDYNPTGLSTASIIRQDGGGADRTVTGLTAQADGTIIAFQNVGTTNSITLSNQSGSSTAANRFLFTGDTFLPPGAAAFLRYDNTTQRWRSLQNGQPLATASILGQVRCDGTTITCAAGTGVITAVGAAATSVGIGTTTIASGTTLRVLYDNAGVLGEATLGGLTIAAGKLSYSGGAFVQQSISSPAGVSSTSFLMQGLGSVCTITPTVSGRIAFNIRGPISNSVNGAFAEVQLAYGTGAAPSNGAAASGTVLGAPGRVDQPSTGSAGLRAPFTVGGVAGSFSLGTAVWFDAQLKQAGGGLSNIGLGEAVSCDAWEF